MLVKTYGSAVHGVDAKIITLEVHLGTPYGFTMVGLPDNAVRESKERVETAIKVNGYRWPRGRLVVNMAPADIRKEGSAYDLTLATAVLAASGQISSQKTDSYMVMGELSLDGTVHPIRGVLPIAISAQREGFKGFILPAANAAEASIVKGLEVIPVESLLEAAEFLDGRRDIDAISRDPQDLFAEAQDDPLFDFSDVKGQFLVKRGLEVAAAGGHNALMVGPPGAGKTMLAKRLPTILPPLTIEEALDTTKIHSVAGRLGANASLLVQRPFRSPHHTISDVALVGGGSYPQPGEISLAHNGILFLDELPEFKRSVLEVLRQPMEERSITVSRARFTVDYPANFMLMASMNPCPCGYYNHPDKECHCGPQIVRNYHSRISGPLMDRVDLQIEVTPVNFEQMSNDAPEETSAEVRKRVIAARKIQQKRFEPWPDIYCNAMMPPKLVHEICQIDETGRDYMQKAMNLLGLSARAYDRILKVARTIADLDASPEIAPTYVAEAIGFRSLDRDTWAG